MRPLKSVFLSLVCLGLLVPTLGAQEVQSIEIAEWDVPWEQSRPRDPYVAPDGKVWFVGQRRHYVAWLDRETGEYGIKIDSEGHPWIVLFNINKIATVPLKPRTVTQD